MVEKILTYIFFFVTLEQVEVLLYMCGLGLFV